MYRPLKLVILDENNTPLTFEKGIRLTMQRELYTPFTALNAEFVSESSLNASRICSIKLLWGEQTVFHGIPDKAAVTTSSGMNLITLSARSYTSLTANNEPEPGIKSDVDLNSLVTGCLTHPDITIETGTPVVNYIYVKPTSTLWSAIIAYNLKARDRLPYIHGTNKIMSTLSLSRRVDYTGVKLLSQGTGVNTMNMLSDVHMRIGDGTYDYNYNNPQSVKYSIKRSRYYEMDRQWLYDINKGLVYKTALSNQKRNYAFFEYPSFADEQLFDRVSNTATQCDNKYINAVFLTADSKGIRTRISCYNDDLGQK